MARNDVRDAGFHVSLFGRTPTPQVRAEPRPAIKCSRLDGGLMMNVRLSQNGREVRHRIFLDDEIARTRVVSYASVLNGRTACDVTLAGKFYSVVEASLEDELCGDGCFTPLELRQSLMLRARTAARRHDEAVKEEAERSAERERLLDDLAEKRRARTTPPISNPEPKDK